MICKLIWWSQVSGDRSSEVFSPVLRTGRTEGVTEVEWVTCVEGDRDTRGRGSGVLGTGDWGRVPVRG